jgi:hypothetical protein
VNIRKLTGAVVLTMALAGGLTGPASADPPGPVGPGSLDWLIALLPPLPTAYQPYTGSLCRSGSSTCIDGTIRTMRERLAPLAGSCEHDAVFSLAYLRVTEDVRRAMRAGHFRDRVWLNQVDIVFAHLYFDTMDDWHAGRTSKVPQAWKIALRAEDDRTMTGLGNFLLAMNAHINRDFPHVLATVGLTAKDGTSHKRDHNAYNSRLDGLYHPVFAEEAARFDPTFDDLDFGQLDELGVGAIMRGWREMVWRHAELLVRATTPQLRQLVEREIDEYAATQAKLIRATFSSSDSSARDDWCAAHHG